MQGAVKKRVEKRRATNTCENSTRIESLQIPISNPIKHSVIKANKSKRHDTSKPPFQIHRHFKHAEAIGGFNPNLKPGPVVVSWKDLCFLGAFFRLHRRLQHLHLALRGQREGGVEVARDEVL